MTSLKAEKAFQLGRIDTGVHWLSLFEDALVSGEPFGFCDPK
jgi:hypothetical protein